jgi:hypothetical protein
MAHGEKRMSSTLHALLGGVLDYAGLFPPARLPLHEAIKRYARYRHDPASWMLGRFVCPAEQLGELTPLLSSWPSSASPLAISVLGRGGKSASEFLAGLRVDVEAMNAFRDRHGDGVELAVLEVRLPSEVLAPGATGDAHKLLEDSAKTLEDGGSPNLTLYYEAVPGIPWRAWVKCLSVALTKDVGRSASAGFKLRCGGQETTAFPSPEQIAAVIAACRDAGVPLKFTAGLHHPFRHFDRSLQTYVHGFLNVFAAGVLAYALPLTEEQVRQIIEDVHHEDFAFDDEGLRWKDYRASVSEIKEARRSAVVSFGSCSFEEPRADLRAMGLLK